jgi:cobalamin biosynthesis protein CobT
MAMPAAILPPPVFKLKPVPFAMRQQVTVRALGMFAKILGKQYGVRIVFDPNIQTAATDCRDTIFLPVLTDTGSEEDADLLYGLVSHEAAHCADTDPDVMPRVFKQDGALAKSLTNLYEDPRIEKKQQGPYPGAQPMIDKALAIMVKRGIFKGPSPQNEPLETVFGLLISGLRTKYLGQTGLAAHFPLWHNKCVEQLGAKTTRALWRIAMEVRSAASTEDAYQLAKKTMRLLKDLAEGNEPEEPPPPPGSGNQGQGQGQGQNQSQDQDQAQGQGKQDDQDADDQGSTGKQGPKEPSMKEKQKNAQSVIDATEAEVNEQPTDFGNAVDQALEEWGAKQSSSRYGRGAGSGRNDIGKRIEDHSGTEKIIARSHPISVRLGNELEALLEAKTDADIYWQQTGRKIDASKLPRVATGNFSVFKHRDEREGLNTAFSVLVDISGSMDSWGCGARLPGDAPMTVAENAIWAVLQAVDRFDGVVSAGAAFGTSYHPFKTFDETFRGARHFMWNRNADSGGTDTHYAVQKAGESLLMRTEARRLLLIITDGVPSNVEATAAAMGELLRADCEVAMLFIAASDSSYGPLAKAMDGTGATFAVVASSDHLVRGIFEAISSTM